MIYETISALCDANNMTIAQLERELKLSNATIRRWKKSSPTVANAQKVAEYFGITLDSLVRAHESEDKL